MVFQLHRRFRGLRCGVQKQVPNQLVDGFSDAPTTEQSDSSHRRQWHIQQAVGEQPRRYQHALATDLPGAVESRQPIRFCIAAGQGGNVTEVLQRGLPVFLDGVGRCHQQGVADGECQNRSACPGCSGTRLPQRRSPDVPAQSNRIDRSTARTFLVNAPIEI